ncbi:MAG: glycosyltransferase family 4 protein [Bacteroidetes bacterium]|jgi:glycosyltransferase involved in cell wall biosynthesis|nr:glycosyltransferase family 4 protein [Bacteroidota bacterium]MBT6687050.1 glycosyltransferase family 4 protein [Bacteroidota bacterium]MBT7144118.1 glycosyltransferase family 4 protein [Bacteroidota bacterium]MBT7492569.1 glycosyltransferase family 4 protein [Bacteroidota bacterium]
MRIAILADPLDNQYAGVHIYTKEMIKSLIKYDQQNEYILIRQKKDNKFTGIEQHIIPNFPKIPTFASLRLFVIVPFLLRKLKVDAVVEPAHFGPFNLPKRIKRITIIHDLTPIIFSHLHRYHSQLLQKIFLKRILKKADIIISNSENTTKDLHKYYPFTKGKVNRIYLGRDKDFRKNENAKIISKLNLDKKYFLSVGTIEPRKNLVTLLEAYQIFRRQNTEIHKLIIVGKEGWKTENFFSALENHPFKEDIEILGYVSKEELTVLYSQAIALIYPSLYEGFGLPILEAMSCGTACIVSDSSSLPEVGGDAAKYFSPTDANELCEAMLEISKNEKLRYEMNKKSLSQSAKFSWEIFAKEFQQSVTK